MRRRPVPCSGFDATPTPLPFHPPKNSLTSEEFTRYQEGWLLDCESRQHSQATLANRAGCLGMVARFLEKEKLTTCDTNALRRFFIYCAKGQDKEGGRWGKKEVPQTTKPGTIASYHRILSSFFAWVIEEHGLQESPMRNIKPPVDRPDQIQPFTNEQIAALEAVARKHSRNYAILLMLLDTGLRASEACSLRVKDLDFTNRSAVVEGKGGKTRRVYWGKRAGRVLWQYLAKREGALPEAPVFPNETGPNRGEAMRTDAMHNVIDKLGEAAGIENVRASPHTCRHTFALNFLRNGGNQFTLMQILGHTNIRMTARYVQLAQADIAAEHRKFSPMDNIQRKS